MRRSRSCLTHLLRLARQEQGLEEGSQDAREAQGLKITAKQPRWRQRPNNLHGYFLNANSAVAYVLASELQMLMEKKGHIEPSPPAWQEAIYIA